MALLRPFAPLSPLDNFLPQWLPDPPPRPPVSLFDPSTVPPSISADVTVHAVCNVPLIAPRPLPYHSPTFLQFDLPDTDEDLSHPPYTHRPSKRKRADDDPHPQSKRRLGTHRWRSRPWDSSHRSGNHHSRT